MRCSFQRAWRIRGRWLRSTVAFLHETRSAAARSSAGITPFLTCGDSRASPRSKIWLAFIHFPWKGIHWRRKTLLLEAEGGQTTFPNHCPFSLNAHLLHNTCQVLPCKTQGRWRSFSVQIWIHSCRTDNDFIQENSQYSRKSYSYNFICFQSSETFPKIRTFQFFSVAANCWLIFWLLGQRFDVCSTSALVHFFSWSPMAAGHYWIRKVDEGRIPHCGHTFLLLRVFWQDCRRHLTGACKDTLEDVSMQLSRPRF